MKKTWLVVVAVLCALLGAPALASAAPESNPIDPEPAVAQGHQIVFENGVHYVIDPVSGKKVTLFCMNNLLHWPHHTDDMGDLQVPGYNEGYLTPGDFKSQKDYEECLRRLAKLLYAGYPYNGEYLYKIVKDSSGYAPTEGEFNAMLVCPPQLQTAYPYLGHHDFSYADWKNQNKEHLEQLRRFVNEAIQLSIHGGTTSNGLTFADVSAMPFYRAAFSIINCNSGTPLTTFQYFYGASYYVTEAEAYNATQEAIWHLLHEYGIPDNNLATTSLPLSDVLLTYSEHGGLLEHKPDVGELTVSGNLKFTYNPKDGMWHSGTLRINEPDGYNGIYQLGLPKGITAQCDNLTYVYGNEDYELVSDHQPTVGEQFTITAKVKWLRDVKQYSPAEDVEHEGKKFQHMIGAVIEEETLVFNVPFASENVGGIDVSKKVTGEQDCAARFNFRITLYDAENRDAPKVLSDLNGLYGDFEFHGGIAEFDLGAGELKGADNLPSGAKYVIEELDLENMKGYRPVSPADGKAEGVIGVGATATVEFVNEKIAPEGPDGTEKPDQPGKPGADNPKPEPPAPTDPAAPNADAGDALPQTGDDSMVMAAGVAGLAVVLLILGFVLRKRRK